MTMKHNWEYKRLGDICDKGSSNLMQKDLEISDKGFEVFGASGSLGKIQFYQQEKPYVGIVKDGSGVGRCKICPAKSSLLGTLQYIIPKESVTNAYLCYLLQSLNLSKYVNGAAIPHIYFKDYKKEIVPVPSIDMQKHIVAELDKIIEVIEDCRELIRNLDILADSLFYNFFGDPIANPKGFKLKKLGEINEISSAKRVLVQDVVDNGIPFIRGTELACLSKQNSFDPSVFTMFITPEHYERVKSITGVPKPHDLLIPSINADGYIWEINTPEPLYFKDGRVLWVHVNHEVNSSKWLKFTLSKIIKEKYANLSRGAVFAELTLVFLRNLDVIVPPRSLQEKFATHVEQIERQKKTVEKTIANLQLLLDSRMDYWFN